MPVIKPSLVPTVPPGSLFQALTTKQSLNVRWLTSLDPVFFEVLNRPLADITLRQLILAKSVDQLNTSLGRQSIFPFIVQPHINAGAGIVDVPLDIVWDLNISLPAKWQKLRLAKIKRVAGINVTTAGTGGTTGGTTYTFTGRLRFVFTATQVGGAETAILEADYQIDSPLTYQPVIMHTVQSTEELIVATPADQATISGFIIFKTMDPSQILHQNFLLAAIPPTAIALGSDGNYVTPTSFETTDMVPGSQYGWFDPNIVKHGSGMLDSSAWNGMPTIASDIQSWVNAFNYPFDAQANRIATNGITIPLGMFKEFNITAPAGDQPTGDTSGLFFPVWITRIVKVVNTGVLTLRAYFATHNVTDTDDGGAPSPVLVEFATLDLAQNMVPGQIVNIIPLGNLESQDLADPLWNQHFGRGHVVLADIWGPQSSLVSQFFSVFTLLAASASEADFTPSSTRLASFGISRIPKYIPTIGQSHALKGSTGRLSPAINPGTNNRYVTEGDQGILATIDLEAQPGITPDPGVDRFGGIGGLCSRAVRMIVDASQEPSAAANPNYYTNVILPRLTILLGRPPQFNDVWFNGIRFMRYSGDSWVG